MWDVEKISTKFEGISCKKKLEILCEFSETFAIEDVSILIKLGWIAFAEDWNSG